MNEADRVREAWIKYASETIENLAVQIKQAQENKRKLEELVKFLKDRPMLLD